MATRRRVKKRGGNKGLIITILVIVLVIALVVAFVYFKYPDTFQGILDSVYSTNKTENTTSSATGGSGVSSSQNSGVINLAEEDCSVHFIELGNDNAGDCILVKTGNTEVLIDAGSKSNSIDTISAYIDKYCTDGILEYVIVTHGHEDHIACFGGTASAAYRTIFDRYICQTIIDFPLTNSTTALYSRYLAERNAEVEAGAVRYSALECWNNENGAQRTYQLSSTVSLNILYNYYYEHHSSDENNYSVCCLITAGTHNYLLTGDLEKEGEEYLVQCNDLPQVDVFKAGHHGSYSSSTEILLSVIKPQIVVFTAVMGKYEYTTDINNVFPSKTACTNISKYTNNMYVNRYYDSATDTTDSYNGNIVIIANSSGINVICSNKTDSITESDWYKTYRA